MESAKYFFTVDCHAMEGENKLLVSAAEFIKGILLISRSI